MSSHEGKCGCGSIEYSINDDPVNIINCRCNMCKNHNGSAFSTYAIFPERSFKLSNGEEFLSKYVANDGVKIFCKKCGTPLFNAHEKYPGVRMVYIGTLSLIDDIKPRLNAWSENQLAWISDISDIKSLPQS